MGVRAGELDTFSTERTAQERHGEPVTPGAVRLRITMFQLGLQCLTAHNCLTALFSSCSVLWLLSSPSN